MVDLDRLYCLVQKDRGWLHLIFARVDTFMTESFNSVTERHFHDTRADKNFQKRVQTHKKGHKISKKWAHFAHNSGS
jgi:hypothetical protein